MAEVRRLSSLAKRSQSLTAGVASRHGQKPVLSEIDAENAKIKARVMQQFLLRKSEKAFDPRTFYHNETYVYVVPHTHTDLGWLKTMKDYYDQGKDFLTRCAPNFGFDAEIAPQTRKKVCISRCWLPKDVLG